MAATARPVTELIPPVEDIRSALERAEEDANFLRKLLRLALARQRDPAQVERVRAALTEARSHAR